MYTVGGGSATILGSSTIADNQASGSGDGLYNDDASGAGTEVLNTLLARNGTNCSGTILSDGSNLDTGTTCAFTSAGDQSDVGDANVSLSPLAANGGPVQGNPQKWASLLTAALSPTSPAVDTGSSGSNCPTERARSPPAAAWQLDLFPRAACDIGALELVLAAEKTPQNAVPTLSQWAIVFMGLLLALFGARQMSRTSDDSCLGHPELHSGPNKKEALPAFQWVAG